MKGKKSVDRSCELKLPEEKTAFGSEALQMTEYLLAVDGSTGYAVCVIFLLRVS